MLKRLSLLAVAAATFAAPLHAQASSFTATGGDVQFALGGYHGLVGTTVFLEAIGAAPRRLLFSVTTFGVFTFGTTTGVFGVVPPDIDLGTFAAGDQLHFTYSDADVSSTQFGLMANIAGGYQAEFFPLVPTPRRFGFEITGVSSASNTICTPNAKLGECAPVTTGPGTGPGTTPVTGTPEPGTIALFATGLAGLIPMVRRKRRAA